MKYNFRTRNTLDEMLFGKEQQELINNQYSLPPKYHSEKFSIIRRPKIPELDGFENKYLTAKNKKI